MAFKRQVEKRYSEGTLQRLLEADSVTCRRAAVLSLGLMGTMDSNAALASRLHDPDPLVSQLASDTLWAIWFRADSENNTRELQRLVKMRDPQKTLNGLNSLIQRSSRYAEAYNQRAIVHFGMKEFQKSIADCERALKLNPFHFGALSGMAQCYMNLRKPAAALKAFRNAQRIHPGLEGVEETIRALESTLGEEGRRE
jgi:tetratricopeptide (TPR) repeat protein